MTHAQVVVALKHLDRGILSRVKDVPVVDGAAGDETNRCLADPLPELNILVHGAGLEFLLLLEVEDLEGASLSLEGDDLASPMHDGTISLDRPPRHVVPILELDDDDLGLGILALLFPDTHVGVGFECLQSAEAHCQLWPFKTVTTENWNKQFTVVKCHDKEDLRRS